MKQYILNLKKNDIVFHYGLINEIRLELIDTTTPSEIEIRY